MLIYIILYFSTIDNIYLDCRRVIFSNFCYPVFVTIVLFGDSVTVFTQPTAKNLVCSL